MSVHIATIVKLAILFLQYNVLAIITGTATIFLCNHHACSYVYMHVHYTVNFSVIILNYPVLILTVCTCVAVCVCMCV